LQLRQYLAGELLGVALCTVFCFPLPHFLHPLHMCLAALAPRLTAMQRILPYLLRAALGSPAQLAQVAVGTYLMIVLNTAMALPGPLGRRSWLVSLLAPALTWLGPIALDAWPLRLLPFVDGLTRLVRLSAQALALAASWDLLILTLVLICAGVRRRHVAHRATMVLSTAPLTMQQLPNGDTVPLPPVARAPAFRRVH